MKKLSLVLLSALAAGTVTAQSVGINTTPATTAALDVSSTTKGMLVPRMSTAQRTAISSPAQGLLVYDLTANSFYYYNGSAWTAIGGGGTSSGGSNTYGDGSGGALSITSSTNWVTSPPSSLNFQFSSISVASGQTLTVPSGTRLHCSGTVTIAGNIVVAPGENTITASSDKGIARTASVTGTGRGKGVSPITLTSLVAVPEYGGGAGGWSSVGDLNYGGGGGGALGIYASGAITVTGTIQADGGDAFTGTSTAGNSLNGSGGGGGGIIVLASKTSFSNSGTISASGGDGSNAGASTASPNTIRPAGGGGGGGVVMILAPTITQGTVQVPGGSAGTNSTGTTNSSSTGGAGGGSGGDGGIGSALSSTATAAPAAGSAGLIRTIITSTPENLY